MVCGRNGTIAVVPGDCLEPVGDFVENEDYTDNNVAVLLARGNRKFVRVKTFGPLSAQALDADGDHVADEIENALDGYHSRQSVDLCCLFGAR